jgi:hypothetical protein
MLRKHFIARLRSRSEKSSSGTKYWEQSCQFSGSGISWFCPLSLFARKGVASMPKSDAYTSTEKSSLDEVAMSNDDLLSWRVKNCKRSRSEKSSSETKYWEQSCQFSGSGISLFCPLSLFARKGVASMPKSDAYTSTEKSSLDEVAMSNDDLLSCWF